MIELDGYYNKAKRLRAMCHLSECPEGQLLPVQLTACQ